MTRSRYAAIDAGHQVICFCGVGQLAFSGVWHAGATAASEHEQCCRCEQSSPDDHEPDDRQPSAESERGAAPVSSDVYAGTYRCTNCGYELSVQSVQSLPRCPECSGPYGWEAVSGGEGANDPYPERQA